MADVIRGGHLAAARFWAGMILHPLPQMRGMGLSRAATHLATLGFTPGRKRQILYVTGAANVAPVLQNPTQFRTSNVPRRAHGGGAQARLRRGALSDAPGDCGNRDERHPRRAQRCRRHRFLGACVGSGLAMIMIKVTLAAILKARRPRLVQGARIDTVVAINLRCRGPMPVIMAGRDAAFHDVAVSGSALLLYDPPSKGARRSY